MIVRSFCESDGLGTSSRAAKVAIISALLTEENAIATDKTIEIKRVKCWDFKDLVQDNIFGFNPDKLKKSRGKGKIKQW